MIRFGTKAETIAALRSELTLSRVCDGIVFTVGDWRSSREAVLARVSAAFGDALLIIRSSALAEDTMISSMAGAHDSIPSVSCSDSSAVGRAVDLVAASYSRHAAPVLEATRNQVLVQPMVTDVSMSGVVFTQDLNTGGPYYVINYDDVSGKTDTVTSGTADTSRTLIVHKDHVDNLSSSRFRSLLDAIREIEKISPSPGLDIEFSVTRNGQIVIFQVRPLAVQSNWNRDIVRNCNRVLNEIRAFVESSLGPQPGVVGRRSIFTEMSDWNPAEMIGPIPRRLALSLYRQLITDVVWAQARSDMGYRTLGEMPLMVSLGGRVYIDVRKSFNSFLPTDLPLSIGAKLVDLWLDRLEANPELHDKVEFEVATTSYPLDFDERTAPDLLRNGFSKADVDAYRSSLLHLTNRIVGGKTTSLVTSQLMKVEHLRNGWQKLAGSVDVRGDGRQIPAVISALLCECRAFGTLPFAILARCAFIAEDMLRALVRLGLLAEADARAFRGSVRTVLSDFLDAAHDYYRGKMTREAFCGGYGHLRPGTYDITSLRYDQRDSVLQPSSCREPAEAGNEKSFALTREKCDRIDAFLTREGLTFDSDTLFEFMRLAIKGREYAKLQFTKNLSDALELIAQWGHATGLSREELSHLDIHDIVESHVETPDGEYEEHFREISKRNRIRHGVSSAIRLPYYIGRSSDLFVVPLLKSRPNFVTDKKVTAPVLFLSGDELVEPALEGKVVVIEGADPGYDWIFARDVVGLITKFGGANSHMAIRCAELSVPAAIGCGEQLFGRIVSCPEVTLDCAAGQLIPHSESHQEW